MRSTAFQRLLESMDKLSMAQIERLSDALKAARSRRAGLEVLEKARPVACRRCGSLRVVRNGHRGELQRYLCRDCGKTSNATTDTPLARLRRRETFEAYARCLAKGFTVRQAAKACSVSVSTAHRWRLRFLEKVVEHQPKALSGLLEVDETYFRISHKGSRSLARPPRHRGGEGAGRGRKASEWAPVLVGRLRGQRYTTDKLLTRVTAAEVTRALRDVVRRGQTVVCTDGGSAFLNLEKDLGVPAKSLVVGYDGHVMDGVYHVQSANSYHERLKSWVNRKLRGVATKNLPLYLAWMRLQTWGASGAEPRDILTSALGKQVINL